MKKLGLACGFCFGILMCSAQGIDIKDLTGLLDLNPGKMESHLKRKGFKKEITYNENDEFSISFIRAENEKDHVIRGFHVTDRSELLIYKTTSKEEFKTLSTELITSGFHHAPIIDSTGPVFFQKENIAIETSVEVIDTSHYYVFKAERKVLPKRKDIQWAEDLLALDSHQFLIEVFGKENVRADYFFYSKADSNKCSVIFPQTSREAIFVWADETNLRTIDFIIIGGSLRATVTHNQVNAVSQNAWRSRQGTFCGMSLAELQNLNKKPLRFYNWTSESAGFILHDNKGEIDFNKIGLVFNCMNCSFLDISSSEVLDSQEAIHQSQKVYVATMIILPVR